MSSNFTNPDTISGGGFFIEHNRLTETDAPGEFYFDDVGFKLYVNPMHGHLPSSEMWFLPTNATMTAADDGKGAALSVVGLRCAVNGLAFRYGFVAIDAPYSFSATNIDVRDMVTLGVDGNMRIVGSTFSDIGAIGANLMPGGYGLAVQSCSFRNVALWAGYYDQPTGVMCFATCSVEGSTFDGMGYAAVYPNKPYSAVTGNVMRNTLLSLADGGAVYFGSVSGVVLTGNTVVNIAGNTISGASAHRDIVSAGFYLDSSAYNATIVGNTFLTGYGANPDMRQSCVKLDGGMTTVADNVCVGGKLDIELTGAAIVTGLAIDRNLFSPTPGTPGQAYPILIRLGQPNLQAPYLPTAATFQSIAGNDFCMAAPGVGAASWNPIFIGVPPPSAASDLGIANFVDVQTNQKDTSGTCRFTTPPPPTTTWAPTARPGASAVAAPAHTTPRSSSTTARRSTSTTQRLSSSTARHTSSSSSSSAHPAKTTQSPAPSPTPAQTTAGASVLIANLTLGVPSETNQTVYTVPNSSIVIIVPPHTWVGSRRRAGATRPLTVAVYLLSSSAATPGPACGAALDLGPHDQQLNGYIRVSLPCRAPNSSRPFGFNATVGQWVEDASPSGIVPVAGAVWAQIRFLGLHVALQTATPTPGTAAGGGSNVPALMGVTVSAVAALSLAGMAAWRLNRVQTKDKSGKLSFSSRRKLSLTVVRATMSVAGEKAWDPVPPSDHVQSSGGASEVYRIASPHSMELPPNFHFVDGGDEFLEERALDACHGYEASTPLPGEDEFFDLGLSASIRMDPQLAHD